MKEEWTLNEKIQKGNKINKQEKEGQNQFCDWTTCWMDKLNEWNWTGNDFLQALKLSRAQASCLLLRGEAWLLAVTKDTIRCHGTSGVPDSLCIPYPCPTEKYYASPSPKVSETPEEVSWIASQTHRGPGAKSTT